MTPVGRWVTPAGDPADPMAGRRGGQTMSKSADELDFFGPLRICRTAGWVGVNQATGKRGMRRIEEWITAQLPRKWPERYIDGLYAKEF